MRYLLFFSLSLAMLACNNDDSSASIDPTADCESDQVVNTSRGECNEDLTFTPEFEQNLNANNRRINSNNIPEHMVGRFGMGQGSLNPNAISPQSALYRITLNPTSTGTLTPLLQNRPTYSFGVLLNGVELDPVAAEPFPHNGTQDPNANWDWNLEALTALLGLDCNNAHVQPNGKYHYHGTPTSYIEEINPSPTVMTLIGYAADGFPIYYKYAYSDANDASSPVIEMTPSYQLKAGERPGDGVTAPCGEYNGVYTNDYEFVVGLGNLDEANGRTGVTPEYPNGTFYYVITEDFPSIPRYFRGTPSDDFRL